MARADQYAMLICSLPPCNALFAAQRAPISRFQLQQRLSILEPQDRQDIELMAEILDWFKQPSHRTDSEFLQLCKDHLGRIESQEIRQMLQWRMTFRTVIGALRLRHRGGKLTDVNWGYGRWVSMMNRHWTEPTLGLESMLPWVSKVVTLLKEEKPLELEKHILQLVWDWLDRLAWYHQFDLAAVAIYRMRWDLVYRWSMYAPEPAAERFEQLLTDLITPLKLQTGSP